MELRGKPRFKMMVVSQFRDALSRHVGEAVRRTYLPEAMVISSLDGNAENE
jgi:hypothetical protein